MEYLRIQPGVTVLVLNASYEPLNITDWKRAVVLLLKEKAQLLSARVIRLVNYIRIPFSKIMSQKPTRSMIYERDEHTCQYCGAKKNLSIDHVIPRCRGGEDTWENLVVACSSCNVKKGSTPLEQTGMKLMKTPRPMQDKVIRKLNKTDIQEWKDYSFT
jgi:5-methylcytosine-specific restriction endonuclease McrA